MEAEANWNVLPSEIHRKIIGYLDVPARLQLAKVSRREADSVHAFGKQNIKLVVNFDVRVAGSQPAVEISVLDNFNAVQISIEVISSEGKTQTSISFNNELYKTKTQEGKKSLQIISTFLRWALTEKTFIVRRLETTLKSIGRSLDVRPEYLHYVQIIPEHCRNKYPAGYNVFNSRNLTPATVWLLKPDFITVVHSRNMIYEEIEEHSVFDEFKFTWIHLSVLIDYRNKRISCFARALQLVRSLGLEFPEIKQTLAKDETIRKLESPKAIENIMYFIRAYHRGGNHLVTYLDNDPNAQRKIAFLKEGLNITVLSLSDTFQLALMIVVYRLRLILNEPGVSQVYERVCESFKLVLKDYANYYSKIMDKIEKLVEGI